MKDINTEQKILQAARQVFISKGMDGARMQEIADEAGLNKALLHYYYRSKDKLFEAVFTEIFTEFFGKVGGVLLSEVSVEDKVILFVDTYIDTITANPFVPQFIINEINRDPSMMKELMQKSGFNPKILVELFDKQFKDLKYDIRHFIVSILGLCIFPYAARPLMQTIYFENDSKAYEKFLSERKEFVKSMILNLIEK
jgi:TetR/AcrR family transcriptional regulator